MSRFKRDDMNLAFASFHDTLRPFSPTRSWRSFKILISLSVILVIYGFVRYARLPMGWIYIYTYRDMPRYRLTPGPPPICRISAGIKGQYVTYYRGFILVCDICDISGDHFRTVANHHKIMILRCEKLIFFLHCVYCIIDALK